MAQSQYATLAELQSIAITAASAGRYGEPAMTAALQSASGVADSYLASQFTLPLQVSPQGWDMSLTIAVANIAAYTLACQFGFNPAAPGDKLIEERYQRAIDWLKTISTEEIFPQWVDASGGTPEATAEGGPFVISDPPVGFTDRGLPFNTFSKFPTGGL
jgi:phage gp36-like protein